MIENREIKSSLFVDLFGDDELVGKRNFLSLYNAIHGSDLKFENTQIERKVISQSAYRTFKNDISMIIDGKLIVLVEHQSTINNNMPLRFLEYYVHLLYGIVPSKTRYNETLYKIPSPEFYVFYNGPRQQIAETLKLSDAFKEPQEEPFCEVKVKITNIRTDEEGKPFTSRKIKNTAASDALPAENLRIINSCDILKQYSEFMAIVFRHQAELKEKSTEEETKGCYERAIREAINKGILPDYLKRKATEVRNMFLDEYDYATDIKVKQKEAFDNGVAEKAVEAAKNLLKMKLGTIEQISQATELPLDKVQKLAEELN